MEGSSDIVKTGKVVFIENPTPQYITMYEDRGWEVEDDLEDGILEGRRIDLVQFTGGSDVTPSYYGSGVHPLTRFSEDRDRYCMHLFDFAKAEGIPMAGICRGGQFLNVMNGGSMYQDVDNHAISGTHEMVDARTRGIIMVSSTHHQMMLPTTEALILGYSNRSTYKEYVTRKSDVVKIDPRKDDDGFNVDVEVAFYNETDSLCFQPHPEIVNGADCVAYYFHLIYLLITRDLGEE